MIQLFDYTKLVFSKKEKEWKKISNSEKSKHFWMLNRFCAIKYPVQASILSHYKMNPITVSDYWHKTMSMLFTSPPGWIYAKTIKKEENEKKLNLPSREMIQWYCKQNEMTRKDFDEHIKFFGEKFLDEIKNIEKILKSQKVI